MSLVENIKRAFGDCSVKEKGMSLLSRSAVLAIGLALSACATTEVTRYVAAPGKDVLIGQGGAVETRREAGRDIDVWIEGSPNRPFRILAKATSTYRFGTADRALARDAAKRQMVAAVAAQGGDGVVFGSESVDSVGVVYTPSAQTTNIARVSPGNYTATTYSSPGMVGAVGEGTIHAYIVKYVDRL